MTIRKKRVRSWTSSVQIEFARYESSFVSSPSYTLNEMLREIRRGQYPARPCSRAVAVWIQENRHTGGDAWDWSYVRLKDPWDNFAKLFAEDIFRSSSIIHFQNCPAITLDSMVDVKRLGYLKSYDLPSRCICSDRQTSLDFQPII